MTTKIYIVEDHPLMQRVMNEFLTSLPDLAVCGVATTAQHALEEIPASGATLVLVDLSLPDMSGIELMRALKKLNPTLRCLMVSSYQELNYVQQALAAGACGYLVKDDPLELTEAIQQVLDGQIYLSERVQTMWQEMIDH